MIKKFLISVAFLGLLGTSQGFAARHGVFQPVLEPGAVADILQLAQEEQQQDTAIKPSEAAMIARNAYPGAKVLGVKLLPSGEYAVTLKVGGSVQKVMVSAATGEII